MPYIKQEIRENLKPYIHTLYESLIDSTKSNDELAGNLNYIIYYLINQILHRDNNIQLNYNNINSIIGFLECCKLELYRRVACPYEDKKISQNGDI